MTSTFYLQLHVLALVKNCSGESRTREAFFADAWARWGACGLIGIHEGTLLAEQAAQQGLETESWVLDAAEAPQGRDWVGGQLCSETQFYFQDERSAQQARRDLIREYPEIAVSPVLEQKHQDWNAQWKASFVGMDIAPFWQVVPPWKTDVRGSGQKLVINPGAGFGTGTHETTRLCLEALGRMSGFLRGRKVLDFGSGSGILTLATALLGAQAVGIEIDELAIDNAHDNARLNGLLDADHAGVHFFRTFEDLTRSGLDGQFDVGVANILRPILLQFSDPLLKRLHARSGLVLSGLIETDLAPVIERYRPTLGRHPEVMALNEWRCLVWWPLE